MSEVLSSWKEIARYFGKGVRTVQRWETEFGLPVRRARWGDKSAVLAIPEELDSWIHSFRTAGVPTELATLRREISALRAENVALRSQLAQQSKAWPSNLDSYRVRDLLTRTSQLIIRRSHAEAGHTRTAAAHCADSGRRAKVSR